MSTSTKQPASVALAIATTTVGALPVFLTGALAVQLEAHLHVGSTAIGAAVATFFGASALSSVRGGRVAERVGPYKVLLVAVGVALIALVGIGLLVTSLGGLLACLFAAGISNGAVQPAANLLLTRAVDRHRQGLAFGVKQAAVPTATLLSGLAVPALALTAGWHAAYLAAGGIAFAIWLVLALRGRQIMPAHPAASAPLEATGRDQTPEASPAEIGTTNECGDGAGEATAGRGAVPEPERRTEGRGERQFDARPLIPLAATMACAVAASNAMGSFVVPGAVHIGVTPGLAGLLSAAGSAFGLSARVGFGWRADNKSLQGRQAADAHLKTVATLIAVGALGYGALASGMTALLLPAVVLTYGGGWGYNGLFNFAIVRAYPHAPARATGVTQVGTYIGGLAGPLGFGIIVDHLGFEVGWTSCGVLAVVAVVGFTVSRRRLRTALAPSPTGVSTDRFVEPRCAP